MKWFTLAAMAVIYGCAVDARAEGPRILRVEYWQDHDSARFAMFWGAASSPDTLDQAPFSHYEVEIYALPATTVGSDTTSGLTDTLAVAYPPIGVSMEVYARVRTVDVDGRASVPWINQPPPYIVLSNLIRLPNPPGPVTADTIIGISMTIVRPQNVFVAMGTMTQVCAILVLTDGTTGLATNSDNARCLDVYQRWLTEVGA